jgi:hypothetical protein
MKNAALAWLLTAAPSRLLRSFDRNDEIDSSFERSNWGFESFAGRYCPGNAFARSSRLVLELDQQCGPGF